MGNPEEAYRERENRVSDVIALRRPDRVPILLYWGALEGKYAGYSQEEMMADRDKHLEANFRINADFAPDLANPPLFFGPTLEALDCKLLKWAGHGLSSDLTFQYVENEYMKADEYDHFLDDPSDFMVRRLWPRIFGRLGVFGSLPQLSSITGYAEGIISFLPFGLPGGIEALDALRKAGEETVKTLGAMIAHTRRLRSAGVPVAYAGAISTPYDVLGDTLRGSKGIMLDMYRRPDKVIRACEKILPIKVKQAVEGARMSGNPRVLVPLHKGAEGFMSLEQFRRFYWPTLREMLVQMVEAGLTPLVIVEAKYASRLDVIKDVPEGKVIYWFDDTDETLAKKVLGDRVCIVGNIPASVMSVGTTDDVKAACRRLIDEVGKDGGFIMSTASTLDDARIENVRVLVDFTREYGVY